MVDFKNTEKQIMKWAEMAVESLQRGAPDSSGELEKSMSFKIKKPMIIQIIMVDYADFVDQGTKPHKVSPSKLKRWASSKGLNEFAVAKSIEKKGTEAQPFLFRFEEALKRFEKFVDKGIVKDFDKMVDDLNSKN